VGAVHFANLIRTTLAVSTDAVRFVGLSNRLSDFDLNQFFRLTEGDIKAVSICPMSWAC
jgi:hypothetical protein